MVTTFLATLLMPNGKRNTQKVRGAMFTIGYARITIFGKAT